MRLFKPFIGTLLATLLCLGAPVSAVTYLYNFSTPTGTLGTSQNYTSNGVTIKAYRFNNTGTAHTLYGKNDGGDESGLGLTGTSDHEITTSNFVQLDLQNLQAVATNPLSLAIGSVQSGEAWNIFQSNTLGSKGSLLATGTTNFPATININPSNRFISVQAKKYDVLLSTLSAQSSTRVPEPGTMLIVGTGLAMAAYRRRKVKEA